MMTEVGLKHADHIRLEYGDLTNSAMRPIVLLPSFKSFDCNNFKIMLLKK